MTSGEDKMGNLGEEISVMDLNVGDHIRSPHASKKNIMRVYEKDSDTVYLQNIAKPKHTEILQGDVRVLKVTI